MSSGPESYRKFRETGPCVGIPGGVKHLNLIFYNNFENSRTLNGLELL